MIAKLLIGVLLISLLSSCSSPIGSFTGISTTNIRGLEYDGKSRSELTSVSSKVCTHHIYLTRTLLGAFTVGIAWFMPQFDIKIGVGETDKLTTAVSLAIDKGRKSGIFNADMLINSKLRTKNIIIPLIYGNKCVVAEGNVISSLDRRKKQIEEKG